MNKSSLISRIRTAADRCLSRLVLLRRERQIRKAKEAVAYWSAKADVWRQLCNGQHMSYERDHLAEAHANHQKYAARLSSLQNTKISHAEDKL